MGIGSPLLRMWVARVWRGREAYGSSGVTVGEDVVLVDICRWGRPKSESVFGRWFGRV